MDGAQFVEFEVPPADLGPPERWRHGGRDYVICEPDGLPVARTTTECQLDRWLIVGGITQSEHTAGLRLRADYTHANLVTVHAAAYNGIARTAGYWESAAERRTDAAEAAYRRWSAGLRAVGLSGRPLLLAVACEDGAWPWARRDELRTALQSLERHYRSQ